MSEASVTSFAEALLGSVGGSAELTLATLAFVTGLVLICNAVAAMRRSAPGAMRICVRRSWLRILGTRRLSP